MDLFVYVVTHDEGFAPNPFHGYCTLATCKPRIRQGAEIGDWVVGLGSTQNGQAGKLIYAMNVEEAMSFDDYWNDPRFQKKKPKQTSSQESQCGDNIYRSDPQSGEWIQAHSYHSMGNGCADRDHVKRDTNPPRALISRRFVYYGKGAIDIPNHILFHDKPDRFIGIRGHRRNFPATLENSIVEWLEDLVQSPGIHDTPTHWDTNNKPSC
ncbi:hypothetical protein [Candidatus Poriferisocius sp.]|uniref:Nmad2 family putative nucleotide modification protein n=1 Tax=Candidatus Poriferisocius sp. TaxID=3101276 RepID=UPI003B02D859